MKSEVTVQFKFAARAGAHFCSIAMFFLPVAAIAYWVLADSSLVLGRYSDKSSLELLTLYQRIAGLFITLLSLMVVWAMLWPLRGLLWNFSKGIVLTKINANLVSTLAVRMSLYATIIIISHAAFSYILTFGAEEGKRIIGLSISSESIALYIMSGFLFVLAMVVRHAAEIHDDNVLIV